MKKIRLFRLCTSSLSNFPITRPTPSPFFIFHFIKGYEVCFLNFVFHLCTMIENRYIWLAYDFFFVTICRRITAMSF